MKWLAIVFLLVVCVSLEQKIKKLEARMEAIALEQTCRTLVEAKLVASCGLK